MAGAIACGWQGIVFHGDAEELERKMVYGITFEQGRQNLVIDDGFLKNIVTKNRDLPEAAVRDMMRRSCGASRDR